LLSALGKPAHVAVLARRQECGQALARLRTELSPAKADGVEPEREGPLTDRRARIAFLHE
jgi:hypothetical protein